MRKKKSSFKPALYGMSMGVPDGFYKEKHSLFREQKPKKTNSFCKKNRVPMLYRVRLAEHLSAHTPEAVFLPTRHLSHDVCLPTRNRFLPKRQPPKNGVIALWPNTRVVKCEYCVSQKQNGFNNKIHWYSILLTFIFKFTERL